MDWLQRLALALVPIVMATVAWVTTIQSRVDVIGARQDERGARIDHIEKMISDLRAMENDPAPKPQAKILIDSLRRDIEILQDRLNALHHYLLLLPVRPSAPLPVKPERRGDAFDLYPQQNP